MGWKASGIHLAVTVAVYLLASCGSTNSDRAGQTREEPDGNEPEPDSETDTPERDGNAPEEPGPDAEPGQAGSSGTVPTTSGSPPGENPEPAPSLPGTPSPPPPPGTVVRVDPGLCEEAGFSCEECSEYPESPGNYFCPMPSPNLAPASPEAAAADPSLCEEWCTPEINGVCLGYPEIPEFNNCGYSAAGPTAVDSALCEPRCAEGKVCSEYVDAAPGSYVCLDEPAE